MFTVTNEIEWTQAQACAECGTDAAYVRHSYGEAICRVCGHENPMDSWNLDTGDTFQWVGGEHGDWPAVLYVTHCAVIWDD